MMKMRQCLRALVLYLGRSLNLNIQQHINTGRPAAPGLP